MVKVGGVSEKVNKFKFTAQSCKKLIKNMEGAIEFNFYGTQKLNPDLNSKEIGDLVLSDLNTIFSDFL